MVIVAVIAVISCCTQNLCTFVDHFMILHTHASNGKENQSWLKVMNIETLFVYDVHRIDRNEVPANNK